MKKKRPPPSEDIGNDIAPENKEAGCYYVLRCPIRESLHSLELFLM